MTFPLSVLFCVVRTFCWSEIDGMICMSLSNDVVLGVGEYHVTWHRHSCHLILANKDPYHTKVNVMYYVINATSIN